MQRTVESLRRLKVESLKEATGGVPVLALPLAAYVIADMIRKQLESDDQGSDGSKKE
jgi:hypothetical protein